MDNTPIHIDEFGTVRFTIYLEDGHSYEFEQGEDEDFLFITLRDKVGRAKGKKVVDLRKTRNKDIIEMYNDYVQEQNSDETGQNSDDG